MGIYIRLVDYKTAEDKKKHFFNENKNRYLKKQSDLRKIPGNPIAYWVPNKIQDSFAKTKLGDKYTILAGMATGNNDYFVRFWYEVIIDYCTFFSNNKESIWLNNKKWVPFNKGGSVKSWYGLNLFLLRYDKQAYKLLKNSGNRCPSENMYFKKCLTWSDVTSGSLKMRYMPNGSVFSTVGNSLFYPENENIHSVIALLNSKLSSYYIRLINPTLHANPGEISKIPYLYNIAINATISKKSKKNISLSKSDWDLRETSWDFRRSPLLTDYSAGPTETEIDENLTDVSWPSSFRKVTEIKSAVELFKTFWKEQFLTLHKNEEELNKIFIDLYGLEDELTPDVPYSEITILQEELDPRALKKNQIKYKDEEIIRQFISYAVGCIFGRYSLDVGGLVLANAGEGLEDYVKRVPEPSFMPDESGILPITEEDDFSDDLPSQFRNFLRVSFGEENFQENLRYIEDVLGKSIRDYLRNNFYKDHVQRYKKRPIYWMITSPSGALKSLIYLHRYTKDTINVFLNDYLRPFEHKIDYKTKGLSQILVSASSSAAEKTKAQKQIDKLNKVKTELENWERDVVYDFAVKRIELDLDDGVKVNYGKLGSILETVKGLNG